MNFSCKSCGKRIYSSSVYEATNGLCVDCYDKGAGSIGKTMVEKLYRKWEQDAKENS